MSINMSKYWFILPVNLCKNTEKNSNVQIFAANFTSDVYLTFYIIHIRVHLVYDCVPVIKFNNLTMLATILAIECTQIEGICIYEQYSRINLQYFKKITQAVFEKDAFT